jgi:hypothetical protein
MRLLLFRHYIGCEGVLDVTAEDAETAEERNICSAISAISAVR